MVPSWGTECTDGGPVRLEALLVRAAAAAAAGPAPAGPALVSVAPVAACAAAVAADTVLQSLALVRLCCFDTVGLSLHRILREILPCTWW